MARWGFPTRAAAGLALVVASVALVVSPAGAARASGVGGLSAGTAPPIGAPAGTVASRASYEATGRQPGGPLADVVLGTVYRSGKLGVDRLYRGGGTQVLNGELLGAPAVVAAGDTDYFAAWKTHVAYVRSDARNWRPLTGYPQWCGGVGAALVRSRFVVACRTRTGQVAVTTAAEVAGKLPSAGAWRVLSGAMSSAPSVGQWGGAAAVVALGPGSGLRDAYIQILGTSGWIRLPLRCYDRPAISLVGSQLAQTMVACSGPGHQLWTTTSAQPPHWSAPAAWGGAVTSTVALTATPDGQPIAAISAGTQAYTRPLSSGQHWSAVTGFTAETVTAGQYSNGDQACQAASGTKQVSGTVSEPGTYLVPPGGGEMLDYPAGGPYAAWSPDGLWFAYPIPGPPGTYPDANGNWWSWLCVLGGGGDPHAVRLLAPNGPFWWVTGATGDQLVGGAVLYAPDANLNDAITYVISPDGTITTPWGRDSRNRKWNPSGPAAASWFRTRPPTATA